MTCTQKIREQFENQKYYQDQELSLGSELSISAQYQWARPQAQAAMPLVKIWC